MKNEGGADWEGEEGGDRRKQKETRAIGVMEKWTNKRETRKLGKGLFLLIDSTQKEMGAEGLSENSEGHGGSFLLESMAPVILSCPL